jgi:hypothetical protein
MDQDKYSDFGDTQDAEHQRISERAHQIWLENGCPEGCDQDHWHQAKLEVEAHTTGPVSGSEDPATAAEKPPVDSSASSKPKGGKKSTTAL